ncbi:protein artichoke-like [Armigeres subalbatus]|uniref:protein artichoke-like n=1 Tax=Armigeres subalbatus TaxID=124917 RepID=UPI002ED682BC
MIRPPSVITIIGIFMLGNTTSYHTIESIKTDNPITNEAMYAEYPNLRELDMSNQTEFEFPKNQVLLSHDELSSYICNSCGVHSIYKSSLSKLPHLTSLELRKNSLEYIHPDSFAHNSRLDKIVLADNELITFNEESNLRHIDSLSILDLSLNVKLDLNQVKLRSERLMIFSCNNCHTSYLDQNTFAGMPRITQVSLMDNLIERIDYAAIDSLSYIKSLILDGNRQLKFLHITSGSLKRLSAQNCSIEGVIYTENLPALESLNVRGNRITHLEELQLLESQNIEILLLDDNEIRKIPVVLIKLPRLQQLCIDQNLLQPYEHTKEVALVYKIRHLRKDCYSDKDFFHQFEYSLPSEHGRAVYRKKPDQPVTNNETIDLSNKDIVYIEQDYLIDFRTAKELLFDNNHRFNLRELQIFLSSTSLEIMSMQNCSITALYDTSFAKLPSLKIIYLQGNNIKALHHSIFMKNPAVTLIDLANNELEFISFTAFKDHVNLETLKLDGNRNLTGSNNSFLQSPSLRNLSCASCAFTRLNNTTFALLPNLRELNLQHNAIEFVEAGGLRHMPRLKYLNLRNNPLKSFSPFLDQLSHLHTLCLDCHTLDGTTLDRLEARINRVTELEKGCKDDKLSENLRRRSNSRASRTSVQKKAIQESSIVYMAYEISQPSADFVKTSNLPLLIALITKIHQALGLVLRPSSDLPAYPLYSIVGEIPTDLW